MPTARTQDTASSSPQISRLRGIRGAAMVEMALVFTLFVMLVWGVITFAVAYSLRENMTHAAQEALRTAVVTSADSTHTADFNKNSAAITKAQSLMAVYVGSGNAASPASPDTAVCPNEAAAGGHLDICTNYNTSATNAVPQCSSPSGGECMTVTIEYHWGDAPLVAPIPGIFAFMPTTMTVTATGRVG